MSEVDRAYLLRRAAEERARARASTSAPARCAHEALARAYDARAERAVQ